MSLHHTVLKKQGIPIILEIFFTHGVTHQHVWKLSSLLPTCGTQCSTDGTKTENRKEDIAFFLIILRTSTSQNN